MLIDKRSEILFCYDVSNANPNGDPLDENKPRLDEETKINLVTDVRLKRTVRDYLFEYKGYNGKNSKDIFVREIESAKGGIQDGKERAEDFKENAEKILNECIDIRLFGGVIPLKDKSKEKKKNTSEVETSDTVENKSNSITFTGPVQFKMGRSLHKVEILHIKGTGAFASEAGKSQATFREEYIVPYSFIVFSGIVNETAASHTKLTQEDVNELLDALWNGTKNLISRSKFGQMPRLLIKIDYKEKGYFLGDLERKIKIVSSKNDFELRSTSDFKLDISELINASERDKVEAVYYKKCDTLQFVQEIPKEWKTLNFEA